MTTENFFAITFTSLFILMIAFVFFAIGGGLAKRLHDTWSYKPEEIVPQIFLGFIVAIFIMMGLWVLSGFLYL